MSDEDKAVLEATNSNEEENFEEEIQDTEDVDVLKDTIERDRIAKQQILARAKKAEAELKALKEKKPEPTQFNNVLTSDDVEVKILKAQNVSQDEIDYLTKLSKLNGTSIIEAQADDIFKAFKAKKEADEKSANAKLGASRGSGSQRKEKTLNTKGLSDEDHKDLWKQSQGR